MTFPQSSRPGRHSGPPPSFGFEPFPHATAGSLYAAERKLRRRHAGRLLIGYLVLAAIVSDASPSLHQRVAGHLSVALILLFGQLVLVVWAVAGHRRGAERLDGEIDRFRQYLADRGHSYRGAP